MLILLFRVLFPARKVLKHPHHSTQRSVRTWDEVTVPARFCSRPTHVWP